MSFFSPGFSGSSAKISPISLYVYRRPRANAFTEYVTPFALNVTAPPASQANQPASTVSGQSSPKSAPLTTLSPSPLARSRSLYLSRAQETSIADNNAIAASEWRNGFPAGMPTDVVRLLGSNMVEESEAVAGTGPRDMF